MRTRARITLAGLLLGATLVGGAAWATIPGAGGVIDGCYRTSTDDQKGQLRVVEDPASCRNNELAIRWNQEGQKGTQGEVGATGATGPKGDTGAAGRDGANGLDGVNGVDGQEGPAGAIGPAGSPGPPGPAGAACLPTDPACVGPQGETGPQGPPGLKGDTGAQGPRGPGSATLWAKVATSAQDGVGVLNANSSLISATRLRTGSYRITFPHSLAFCAIVVTLSGEGGFDAGAFENAGSSVNVGYSYIGGATHSESLDVQVRSYGGANTSAGALADGATLNLVAFC